MRIMRTLRRVRKCRRIVESFRYYGRKKDGEWLFVSAVLRGDAVVRRSVLLAFNTMRAAKSIDWGELHEVQRNTADTIGADRWPSPSPAKPAMKRPAASMMEFAKRRHIERRHTV